MRIGMILDTSFPPDPRVENEAVSLIQAGHEVHLFSLDYKGFPAYEEINGIRVHRYPAGKLLYKFSALAYTVPVYHNLVEPKLRDFIQKTKVEALHVHDMLIAKAVFRVNKPLRLPLVLDLHENRPAIMAYYGFVKRFPGRFLISLRVWRRKQDQFMRQADRVILVTEPAKQEALKDPALTPDKIFVVPNVITPDIFYKYPIDPNITSRLALTYNVLYVGDTSRRRGTDLAIEAIALLKEQVPEIRLVLVGKSTDDPYLKALARKLGVEEHVYFEGWQNLTFFPTYIQASHVCISPLVRNLHHDTTYANKIFQYMAMAKPLVVSDCTAQEDVVREEKCGLIHRAGDAHDLAAKILQLYQNPDLSRELGENGRQAVASTYNWPATSQDLLRLYRELKPMSE